jgi:UDP-N-acetylmuramate--alanine ligase
MGIGGSGMSAVAQIARAQGYKVTGCDLRINTPYIEKVKKLGIPVFSGHSPDHLADTDLLCVTPAVFYQSPDSSEFITAKNRKTIITWQDFMGTYLHNNKYLICVAGTHGKSTVTALAGLLLVSAALDPTVEVGATVKQWHNNVRIGQSKYFISEADEFYDNYKTYKPDVIILTLVEFDHPEYFGTVDKMLGSYQKFINNLKPGGVVIYNQDSPLTGRLTLPSNSISYSLSDYPANLKISQPGNHNRLNALAIIKLGQLLNIPDSTITHTLGNFSGLERRLDLIGEKNGIKVYDDYANHPSSYSASVTTLKQLYPTQKLTAVIEPHTFSRLRVMLDKLPSAFKEADQVIVSKIFASRETDPGDFTGEDIARAMKHPRARYIAEFNDIINALKYEAGPGDVILVMGSGDSYLLSRRILESI